ncbi:RHS repeat-associated core domain-containing protein [Escherichia fergusonii]|uniref:RHS repeat-associated core domain-containing protein n=1 Tax=Escherichia fergusonii TaxID=564 RepID=UPI001CBC52E1|nr:RHS repeat-associated core domain-containing protein [Escherichia fergusonii]MBZ4105732.1 PAAR domain-containing protein [Escherichia fergusonii]MCH5372228.1 PAAR domain-containing protein [Escherichia fergusonii]BED94693.1 type IV secretion protein Rhs [Escherichia fergusonii]BES12419.1 RHS repeat-associated core domain-containing protein [Escherichia fergusonii]HDW3135765.1 PAAR domain-containing protein [Escherichia fergusonii]
MGVPTFAARKGDDIIHTSVLADVLGGLFEAAICVAVGAVVIAAAAPLAAAAATAAGVSAATIAATSAAAGTCAAAGLVGGFTVALSDAGELVEEIAQGAANFISPPSPQGKIATGSPNVHTNDLPAARAAGRLMTEAEKAAQEKFEEEEKKRQEEEEAQMSTGMKALNYVGTLFSYGASFLGQMIDPVVDGPAAGVVEADVDKVDCHKHPPQPVQYLAEGSSQVSINDLPAVRSGDRTTCGGTVSTVVSPNVIIGGKPVVVRPIHNGKIPGVEVTLLALSLVTCRPSKFLKQLPCLLMGMAAATMASKLGEAVRALWNPVHAATGAKILSGNEDLDFDLPARFPLRWQRIYNSRNRDEGLFGQGWRTAFETRVVRETEYTCFYDEGGRELRFVCPPPGEAGFSPDEGLLFAQSEQGLIVIADLDGAVWRLYVPHPSESDHLRLLMLSDEYGNGLQLHYDGNDRLQAITDTEESLRVVLHYQNPQFPLRPTRITEQLLTESDNTSEPSQRLLMHYDYTDQGQLCRVTDADNVCLREFDYTTEALMSGHRMPGGSFHRYHWQAFSDDWRVVAYENTQGERVSIDYDMEQRITTVVHADGLRHHHAWNARYLVEKYTDEAGQCWCYEWNENDLLVRTTDPSGATTAYSYDNAGNPVTETDPLGRSVCTRWLEHRALPEQITHPDGSIHRYFYDEYFGLRGETDALGQRCYYHRDTWGQVTALTDEKGGIQRFTYNERGQISQAQDCSGKVTRYRYDKAYRLAEETDAGGESTHYEYSPAGRPVKMLRADNWVASLSWTRKGQPESYRMGHSNPVRWQYDNNGRLSVVTDPVGHTVRREYDERDRLTHLYNENGEMYRFVQGANDRLHEEKGLDGIVTRYEYDSCDRVISRTWAAGTPDALTHHWQYNAAGEITEKMTPDGRTEYRYTATGNLKEARFYPAGLDEYGTPLPSRKIRLEYDALGQLTAEENDTGRVSYSLDELGNRTAVNLPDGRSLKTLFYGSGHVLNISLDGRMITGFSRDNLHREVSRTQGSLTMRTRYDRLGRPERREIYREGNRMRPVEAWHRQYDSRHNLLSETQIYDYSYQGYSYDDADHVLRHETPLRGSRQWQYDAAGNLLEPSQAGGALKYNRQPLCRQQACEYDVYGRLVQKPGPGGIWRYRYDSEHRMTEAVTEIPTMTRMGKTRHEVHFSYDPLGRRTEKRSVVKEFENGRGQVKETQRVTTFVWEGLRLLAENRDGLPLVYVYEDTESYTPLARVWGSGEKARVDYYRCSQNGMPEALTDEQGKQHWRLEVDTWGETRGEYADERGSYWYQKQDGAPEENLRFAGQYLDRETGLHYNTFRYYAPDMGRFLTPDPIGLAGGINLSQYAPNPLGWIDPLGLKIVTVYHYTDQGGYNGISSQKPYKFKASSPIKGHPKGIYVTTKSPEELTKTPNGFKKLGLTSTKSTHFFEFQIDDSLLKPIRGDRGEFIRYIEGDLDLDRNNVSRHGKTPKCVGK